LPNTVTGGSVGHGVVFECGEMAVNLRGDVGQVGFDSRDGLLAVLLSSSCFGCRREDRFVDDVDLLVNVNKGAQHHVFDLVGWEPVRLAGIRAVSLSGQAGVVAVGTRISIDIDESLPGLE
jgi:hypothetical protein